MTKSEIIKYIILLILCILESLDLIGGINRYLNPKKNKKVNVVKIRKIIFVPYEPGLLYRVIYFKSGKEKGYFDGTVFKTTLVLTILTYVYALSFIILLVLCNIYFPNIERLFITLYLVGYLIFIVFANQITGTRYKRREKNKPLDFK